MTCARNDCEYLRNVEKWYSICIKFIHFVDFYLFIFGGFKKLLYFCADFRTKVEKLCALTDFKYSVLKRFQKINKLITIKYY